MTIHLPGRAAPAPELPSELSRILAEQAERDNAEVALHARSIRISSPVSPKSSPRGAGVGIPKPKNAASLSPPGSTRSAASASSSMRRAMPSMTARPASSVGGAGQGG